MARSMFRFAAAFVLWGVAGTASASLVPVGIFTGNVGLSVDGVGSNNSPVGDVQATVPVGATVLQAYLYSAGTPFPWYSDSPTTLLAYNGAGITLAGQAVTFSALVGAVATPRPDIGTFFTGRADVTSIVQSLVSGAATDNFSWSVDEGSLNNRIDGEVLAIVYSLPSLPTASIALLNGGQDTGGETSIVSFASPLGDPTDPGFVAQLGLAISFSCCGSQKSTVEINGSTLTENAGNFDDGLAAVDGSLITVGGLGDTPGNNLDYANDHELYDLRPFLNTGDTSFSIFTQNPSSDDNIFFSSLYVTGEIKDVTGVPEPETYKLMLVGLGIVVTAARRRQRR